MKITNPICKHSKCQSQGEQWLCSYWRSKQLSRRRGASRGGLSYQSSACPSVCLRTVAIAKTIVPSSVKADAKSEASYGALTAGARHSTAPRTHANHTRPADGRKPQKCRRDGIVAPSFPQGPTATEAANHLPIHNSTGREDKKSSRPGSASQLSTIHHRRRFRKRVNGQGDSERADTSDSIVLSIVPEGQPFRSQRKR